MGKQINYYIGYRDFVKLAQVALDSGCEILKRENGKIIHSRHIDCIVPDQNRYYFYLPQAGTLQIRKNPSGEEFVGGYHSSGNVMIEAGFSKINHADKKISRARLFSVTGYYNEQSVWIARPPCMLKLYEKLARSVRKIAPATDFIVSYQNIWDDTVPPGKRKCRAYISPEMLQLVTELGYTTTA